MGGSMSEPRALVELSHCLLDVCLGKRKLANLGWSYLGYGLDTLVG